MLVLPPKYLSKFRPPILNIYINSIDMTMPNDYTSHVGNFITIWRHLFVFYSPGNEVT